MRAGGSKRRKEEKEGGRTSLLICGKQIVTHFKEKVNQDMDNITLEQYMDKVQIETKLNQWYSIIEENMKTNIPLKTKHTINKPITSPQLKHLQHCSKQIQINTQTYGWNMASYRTYKSIQTKIKEEIGKIKDNIHTESMRKLINNYKDPQKFWKQIKKLKSPQKHIKQHLIKNNIKLTEGSEKEEAFRKIWKNIFRITPEENLNYDLDHQRITEDYLSNNKDVYTPYNTSDSTRLQGNQHRHPYNTK